MANENLVAQGSTLFFTTDKYIYIFLFNFNVTRASVNHYL